MSFNQVNLDFISLVPLARARRNASGGTSVSGRFVSRKINKIRWQPERHSKLGIPPDTFVCGSYDDVINQLTLWKLPNESSRSVEISQIASTSHPDGDVNEIQFVNEDSFLAASSHGNVGLYKITNDEHPALLNEFTWNKIHFLMKGNVKSSCNCIDVMDEDFLSVGSDGKLIALKVHDSKPVRVIEADSSPICCVVFLKHHEALTGSMRGQIKVWDFRKPEDKPTSTMYLTKVDSHSGPQGYPATHHPAATAVARHPTQSHILVSGGEDGDVTVWDLRQTTDSVCVLQSHEAAVRELRFHPNQPDHLFSCSEKGQIWHWDCRFPPILNPYETNLLPRDQCTWLALGMSQHRPKILSMMPELDLPINSLDVSGETLLCSSDNEAVYFCKQIKLNQFMYDTPPRPNAFYHDNLYNSGFMPWSSPMDRSTAIEP